MTTATQELPDSVVRFEPGFLIELTDLVGNFRKLGVVSEAGDSYYDLSQTPQQLYPIFSAQNPTNIGSPTDWSFELFATCEAKNDFTAHDQYKDVQRRLLSDLDDELLYYRACRWLIESGTYNYDEALKAANDATALVVQSAAHVDAVVQSFLKGVTHHD